MLVIKKFVRCNCAAKVRRKIGSTKGISEHFPRKRLIKCNFTI